MICTDTWVVLWEIWVWVRQEMKCFDVLTAPDVRFPNEVAKIHDMGGKVIRLTRCPHPEDTHESETALDRAEHLTRKANSGVQCTMSGDDCLFDAIIDNANMTEDEANKAVLELVTEKGWV